MMRYRFQYKNSYFGLLTIINSTAHVSKIASIFKKYAINHTWAI